MKDTPYRTYVTIDLNNLRHNLGIAGKLAGSSRVLQVLKADAYGHGVSKCAEYAAGYADWFAAATFEEAMKARKAAPDTPVLLFGTLSDSEIEAASDNKITVNIYSFSYAQHVMSVLRPSGKELNGHIKLDTGMNRLGIRVRKSDMTGGLEECRRILAIDGLNITGIYTHFPVGDSLAEDDSAFNGEQYDTMTAVISELESEGYDTGIKHCVSTGGLLCHPEYGLDMVRTGMLGFGQSISSESVLKLGLKPVLSWYAKVVDIRNVPAGESISYGRVYRADSDRKIAVLSVGYADGYLRAYRGANVLIRGHRCPVAGKICMDYTMVDVTDCEGVRAGDTAVLIGTDGAETIYANDLTDLTDFNTNGGVTCGITSRVPRIYLEPLP